MTYDQFAEIALGLPDVTENVKKSEIDLVRAGRHMARLRDKGTVIAIRLPWEDVERVLSEYPELFFVTPHYLGWPYALAKIEDLDIVLAQELIKLSWEIAPVALPIRKVSKN